MYGRKDEDRFIAFNKALVSCLSTHFLQTPISLRVEERGERGETQSVFPLLHFDKLKELRY